MTFPAELWCRVLEQLRGQRDSLRLAVKGRAWNELHSLIRERRWYYFVLDHRVVLSLLSNCCLLRKSIGEILELVRDLELSHLELTGSSVLIAPMEGCHHLDAMHLEYVFSSVEPDLVVVEGDPDAHSFGYYYSAATDTLDRVWIRNLA
jgi:hypothetical protein